MKTATRLLNAKQESQYENDSKSKPSELKLVSDRLCNRLNVDGISDVCEVNVDLMIGVGTGGL